MGSDEASWWEGSKLPGGKEASFLVEKKLSTRVGKTLIFTLYYDNMYDKTSIARQGRSQDVSLAGSVCERSEPAMRGRFWASEATPLGLTARKTSRCNLAEISFVPSSQSTFNISVLRGTQVVFLLYNLLRPGPGATRLAGSRIF